MKQTVVNFVRALAVLLLFVPAPLGVINTQPAMAEPAHGCRRPAGGGGAGHHPEATQDPWTARFLGPAVVVIAVIAIGASLFYYVVRIRGRYRVG